MHTMGTRAKRPVDVPQEYTQALCTQRPPTEENQLCLGERESEEPDRMWGLSRDGTRKENEGPGGALGGLEERTRTGVRELSS
jgi:hypothetical protein